MCAALTLPDDLTPEERAVADGFHARAVAEATERAALAVRVRRFVRREIDRGAKVTAALRYASADLPVSYSTAADMWYQRKAYAV